MLTLTVWVREDRKMTMSKYRRVCARVAGVLLILGGVPSAGGQLFSVASAAVLYGLPYALCLFATAVLKIVALLYLGWQLVTLAEERWAAGFICYAVAMLAGVGRMAWQMAIAEEPFSLFGGIVFFVRLLLPLLWGLMLATLFGGIWDFPRIFRWLLPILPGAFAAVSLAADAVSCLQSWRAISALGPTPDAYLYFAGTGLQLFYLLCAGTAFVLVGVVGREECL